ncbi:enoyl-CoA hydratase [Bradyrhizobium sp. Arg314]
MAYDEIIYEVTDGIATITLNRPDKLNASTFKMEQEIRDAFVAAGRDDDVRVIVLTGAGRGFCAGFDTSSLAEAANESEGALDGEQLGTHVEDVFGTPHPDYLGRYSYFPSIPKPIIAAINGPAVGLGMIMAMFCDVRLASDTAKIGAPFTRLGLVAEHGISWLLPRLVGLSSALDLLFTAQPVNAEEASRIGLVSHVYPSADFRAKVAEYAGHLARNVSPRALRITKTQVYADQYRTLDEATLIADEEMDKSLTSQDFREGINHFLEKRQARFTGR